MKNTMLKNICFLVLGITAIHLNSQVVLQDKNYIHEITPQVAVSIDSLDLVGGFDAPANQRHLQGVQYFDGLGRPHQQIAISASGQPNAIGIVASWQNDWTEGTGSTPFYNSIGQITENNRIYGTNPLGQNVLLWRCGNDEQSDPDGGWNTDYITVDTNTAYRYSVWVKRTGSQAGNTYHGTQNVENLGGGVNNNPYFWAGDLPTLNTWYLLVGVIHPKGYTGGDTGVSGVYDTQGNKVLDGTEFRWGASTISRFRSYLYYSSDINVRQYFYQPVLQKIDGSENTLSQLIGGGTVERPKDLITHTEYDAYGRQTKEYLPYAADGISGTLRTDALTATEAFYNKPKYETTANPYSESLLEASPLNRVLKQAAPGADWALGSGHEIKFDYQANGTDEVRLFEVTFAGGDTTQPALGEDGFYEAGQLYKNITKDENWTPSAGSGTEALNHTTEEFKNKQGQVVLKRTYNQGGSSSGVETHDTYYVYDDYGNLTYVLPPKVNTSDGVSNSELVELGYQYKYDHRNRLIEKKIPGKDWEYIIYNKLDQPVLTQDALLRSNNQWLYTKYDAFGRVVTTGIYTHSTEADQSEMSAALNAFYAADTSRLLWETKQNTPGSHHYYSNTTYPANNLQTHTVNYYDTYVFDLDGLVIPAQTAFGAQIIGGTDTKSLATGSKIRVLDPAAGSGAGEYISTVTAYDHKRRPVYIATTNPYLQTTDIIQTELDFTGKALQSQSSHSKTDTADIITLDVFTYDHAGRLLSQTQQINGGATEKIVKNTYDALGQLESKKVGGSSTGSGSGLQTVDYTYNIRGWLKSINNGQASGGDLFGFKINYNDPELGAQALFNGNISETLWKTASIPTTANLVNENYKYSYDALNRITQAISNTGHYDLSGLTYDKNGNIETLNRTGHLDAAANSFGTMDALTYDYDAGNKLQNVTDTATETGFKDGPSTSSGPAHNDYTYDLNGNMITDANKGITSIAYNHLNLPTTVNFDNGGRIDYIYDATGVKIRKQVLEAGSLTTTDYAGNYVYTNNQLQFFNHPEGYVTPDGSGSSSSGAEMGFDYVYQYKDHLGNIRLSYTDADQNGTIDPATEIVEENNYYPFGLKHMGYNNVTSSLGNDVAQRWKFGGKEYNEELGLDWYDITARNYDPALGRWMNLDPLAEQMRRHSPYNFAFNNPIFWIDPDGMEPCADGENCEETKKEEEPDQEQEKPKEITPEDIDKIIESLPEDFNTGDMLNAIVNALNENENATIKGTTIKSIGEKKANEQLEKLDPNNPEDAKKIKLIKDGLESSNDIFNQIDRVDKKGDTINVVPIEDKIVLRGIAPVNITIKKNNEIVINTASSTTIKLTIEGIGTVAGRVKSATLTKTGYKVKMGGIAPNVEGKW